MNGNATEIMLKNIGMEYENGVTALTNVSIDINLYRSLARRAAEKPPF